MRRTRILLLTSGALIFAALTSCTKGPEPTQSSGWDTEVLKQAAFVGRTALFSTVSAIPGGLASAPGGRAYLTEDEATLTRGKEVFAYRCARCHSSRIPESSFSSTSAGDWDEYWAWSKPGWRSTERMTEMVLADDFLEGNLLSSEWWIPVTLMGTNACSPLAEHDRPSVGTYKVQHPITGEWQDLEMPGGGRGYTQAPSLVSLWSTAPYGPSNSVGNLPSEGTVEARMDSFNDSIEKLLWPERRKT